jgi:hypothetical protein
LLTLLNNHSCTNVHELPNHRPRTIDQNVEPFPLTPTPTPTPQDNKLCLGVAHSDSATGPFSDSHELLCNNDAAQVAKGIGFIDCTLFVNQTTGTPYLVWKIDGNASGLHMASLHGDKRYI